ncbi:MAG: glycosyltransferase 87 family protein [Candidatus Shapirobacteria bacterium]
MFQNPKKIFFLALLIRLLVAPWFYHPDLKSQHFHFQFLAQNHLNIYSYISQNKSHLPYTDTFNYLPLTYFTFGSVQSLLSPLMPSGFLSWINDWSTAQYVHPNLPIFLLILKIPYLILDLALGYLLFKLFPTRPFFKIWLLCPLTLYLIYLLGNFDILPSFLTLLSLYFISKNKLIISGLVFGLAVSLKLYPLMFLPFIILYLLPKIRSTIIFSLFLLLPLFVSIVPFAASPDFWQSFLGSGLTQKLLELKIFTIPVFPVLYLLILLLGRRLSLYSQISLVGLLFFSTVRFHPQWLLWFLPFFIITFSSNHLSRFLIGIFITTFFGYVFLINDQFLTWGHLLPINPLFLSLRMPSDIVRLRLHQDPAIIQIYFKYFMTAVSALLIFIRLKSRAPHNS